ncbi:MAG: sigma-54 dependent transcriptional regulator [bacterium]
MRKASEARLLVIDDHIELARLLADQLQSAGYAVDIAESGAEALALAERRVPDVVVTDLRMQPVDGFDVLAAMQRIDPLVPVIIMTAFGAVDSAIEAMRLGAFHYLTKPFQLDEVLIQVERALAERSLKEENRTLQRLVVERSGHRILIGDTPPMLELRQTMDRVASSDTPLLVLGESGVGKEIVARTIHSLGPRVDRRFVAVNCAALPESILESELFGHVRGAFTGATTHRRGLFCEADGGTLLLDEIGEMAPALQAKLLRVLEDGEVRAVGADDPKHVNVRVIAATHRDLTRFVEEGRFREDLYYRLNVVPVRVPPLRERSDDIPTLAAYFLEKARHESPASVARRLSPEALLALRSHHWPGNVRELDNAIRRAVLLATTETVTPADLAIHSPDGPTEPLRADSDPSEPEIRDPLPLSVFESLHAAAGQMPSLKDLETAYIEWAIQACDGNKTRAARLLGIDVSTLHRRERRRP